MLLHIEKNGQGEPLLFIHTGLQTGGVDFPAQREYFQKDYQVIQPDLRGHGKSVTEDHSNFVQDSVEDLKDTMDHEKIVSAHIAGCSMGALVALAFAKRYPRYVKSLALSGILPRKPDNWNELNEEDNKQVHEIVKSEEAITYFNEIHEGDWLTLLKSTEHHDWYPFDLTGDLSDLEMPTLFLVGEESSLETKGAEVYPQMNEKIHVSVIPFAGHNVHLEQPELYNSTYELFLNNVKDS
ncbi:alpha/beta fold hydrolase [Oceanobacillus kapialis]|uniref:Alpha/beta fold hydrolase n=1 Tax=Oceanobacillus kapialis TaxID=481353 RepID=A0ABW5Q3G4_9BACI